MDKSKLMQKIMDIRECLQLGTMMYGGRSVIVRIDQLMAALVTEPLTEDKLSEGHLIALGNGVSVDPMQVRAAWMMEPRPGDPYSKARFTVLVGDKEIVFEDYAAYDAQGALSKYRRAA